MVMEILTEKELAAELGVSPWTVRTWRIKADLPYFGTAGRIFYRMESVRKWMEDSERHNAAKPADNRKTFIV